MQSNIKIIVFLAFVFSIPQCGMTQEANTYDIAYGVQRVLPSLSVTKATLAQSKVLLDINPYYKQDFQLGLSFSIMKMFHHQALHQKHSTILF